MYAIIHKHIKDTLKAIQRTRKWKRLAGRIGIGIDMYDGQDVFLIDDCTSLLSLYIAAVANKPELNKPLREHIEWWLYESSKSIWQTFDLEFNEYPNGESVEYDLTNIDDFINYTVKQYVEMPDWFYEEHYKK